MYCNFKQQSVGFHVETPFALKYKPFSHNIVVIIDKIMFCHKQFQLLVHRIKSYTISSVLI